MAVLLPAFHQFAEFCYSKEEERRWGQLRQYPKLDANDGTHRETTKEIPYSDGSESRGYRGFANMVFAFFILLADAYTDVIHGFLGNILQARLTALICLLLVHDLPEFNFFSDPANSISQAAAGVS